MTDDQVLLADRYKLGDRLGRGGMAEVRRGFDLRLERTVAVKSLKADLAADPSFQKRFQRRRTPPRASTTRASPPSTTPVSRSTRTPGCRSLSWSWSWSTARRSAMCCATRARCRPVAPWS
jgi:serine/threonine-protein kinase